MTTRRTLALCLSLLPLGACAPDPEPPASVVQLLRAGMFQEALDRADAVESLWAGEDVAVVVRERLASQRAVAAAGLGDVQPVIALIRDRDSTLPTSELARMAHRAADAVIDGYGEDDPIFFDRDSAEALDWSRRVELGIRVLGASRARFPDGQERIETHIASLRKAKSDMVRRRDEMLSFRFVCSYGMSVNDVSTSNGPGQGGCGPVEAEPPPPENPSL
jgi:hypothetical protein